MDEATAKASDRLRRSGHFSLLAQRKVTAVSRLKCITLSKEPRMGCHYQHLNAEERGTIMAMVLHGASGRAIAQALGRAQSTIARELRRNGYRKLWLFASGSSEFVDPEGWIPAFAGMTSKSGRRWMVPPFGGPRAPPSRE